MASMISEHESFQDVNGKPIVNGYIYIGAAGQDPKLNPIVIYSDRELTTPIANPQRTDSYGRSQNKIWVPGRYSLKVEDKDGAQALPVDLQRGELADSPTINLINVQGINDVTADAVPPVSVYVDKAVYVLTVVNTNTDAVTLDFGAGPVPVQKNNGEDLVAGDWPAGSIQRVTYNAFSGRFDTLTFSTVEINEKINFFEPSIIAFNSAPPIKGLVVTSNTTDPDHDINISAGQYGIVSLDLAITKRLDASFVAGTGNGGMVGSLPASGVIYIFLIQNGASVDVYAETTNGGNPPSGWTIIKRIAVRITDASSNLQRVNVSGRGERLFVYPYTAAADWVVSSVSTARTAYPISGVLSCPPSVDAYISHHASSGAAGTNILLTSLDAQDVAPTDSINSIRVSAEGSQDSTVTIVRVNSSRQVGVRREGSTLSNSYYGQVLCWIEDRS